MILMSFCKTCKIFNQFCVQIRLPFAIFCTGPNGFLRIKRSNWACENSRFPATGTTLRSGRLDLKSLYFSSGWGDEVRLMIWHFFRHFRSGGRPALRQQDGIHSSMRLPWVSRAVQMFWHFAIKLQGYSVVICWTLVLRIRLFLNNALNWKNKAY